MPRPRYEQVVCRTALNSVEHMPFRWTLNPYRGCHHACVYCFARATHAYLELGAGEDFSTIIWVKTNVAEVLRGELARRSWRREVVALGTATDPYQPAEGTYRLTRACLVELARFRTPVSIVTKGTLIVRDVDLLGHLADRAGVTVAHSVPTLDEAIWRRTEPGTPHPRQRLRAMQRLRAQGIRAGVFMAPLLPGISTQPDGIAAIARAAADHDASFLGANVVNLGPGVREHYLGFLATEYPALVAEYGRLFPGRYAPKRYVDEVEGRVRAARDSVGVGIGQPSPRAPPPEPAQLTLL